MKVVTPPRFQSNSKAHKQLRNYRTKPTHEKIAWQDKGRGYFESWCLNEPYSLKTGLVVMGYVVSLDILSSSLKAIQPLYLHRIGISS